NDFIRSLIKRNYFRNDVNSELGSFAVKGDLVLIQPVYDNSFMIRVDFFGDEIESIKTMHPITKEVFASYDEFLLFPGDAYTVNNDILKQTVELAKIELEERIAY
ncbi:excinuclease ABC subunit B, partial [Xanthomonas citri pv. citri]|nr:excinuclease ABC subunit B [Xanthomonas citri pv. citri]